MNEPRDREGPLQRAGRVTSSLARRYGREIRRSFRRQACSDADAATVRVAAMPRAFPMTDLHRHALGAVWLGHAGVLIRLGGLTIAADPVFSRRIGPRLGRLTLGLERLDGQGIHDDNLPHADVVLVSHAHYDHLDRPSLARLARPEACVVTSRNTGRLIPRGYGDVLELGWSKQVRLRGVTITAIRPRHWGARSGWDHHRGYNSYLIESGGHRVLFAGDTGYTEAFAGLGATDLAVFGIGSYDPWEKLHATPEQAWEMFESCPGRCLFPVHHSTFKMGEEPPGEPMSRLLAAAGHDVHRVIRRGPGELWHADGEPSPHIPAV